MALHYIDLHCIAWYRTELFLHCTSYLFSRHYYCLGYQGPDCGLRQGQVPRALYIPNGGMCDVTKRPCLRVRVIVDGVADTPSLVCRVVELQVSDLIRWLPPDYIIMNFNST